MDEIKEKEAEITQIEEDMEKLEEVEEEEEEKKEAILSRMYNKMKRFFGAEQESFDESIEENPEKIDEELKEVLKITYKWLTKLSPELISEFRNSEDFMKYKAALKKYGLIKEKE